MTYYKIEITGKLFNNLTLDRGDTHYKLIHRTKIHNGYRFSPNTLHHDVVGFYPYDECKPGGIYFCSEDDLHHWCAFNNFEAYYYAKVSIPDNARVYIEHRKIKSDKVYLGEFKKLWTDANMISCILQKRGVLLKHVQYQTSEMCEVAVNQNTDALQYVKNQTYKICKIAIERYPDSLRLVRNQTYNICKLAIELDYQTIKHVKYQTHKLCKLAIEQDYRAIQDIDNQTLELCELAIKKNRGAFKLIRYPLSSIYFYVPKRNYCFGPIITFLIIGLIILCYALFY
jgi:hypothetical protein